MTYTDPATVRVALTPGGDGTDVGSAASLTDADLNAAIARATNEVNAKLAGRYSLPFTTVPPLVAELTTDLAAYFATLTGRRGDPLQPGDPVGLRYAAAESLLGQLMTGVAVLDVGASTDPVETGQAVVVNPMPAALFCADDFPTPDPYPAGPYSPVPRY